MDWKEADPLSEIPVQTFPRSVNAPSTHPGVVEGDPVLHSVPKTFKTQVGEFVEVADHAGVLPAAIFLLQHLRDADILVMAPPTPTHRTGGKNSPEEDPSGTE